MTAIRPRDLLSDSLLERLGKTPASARGLAEVLLAPGGAAPSSAAAISAALAASATLTEDIAALADVGYLKVALPPEFGGLGCTLRQAACGQRRLARHAPLTALAVSAHLYWTGAAADAYRAGDDTVRWILVEAARGALFAGGHGIAEAGGDLRLADPKSQCERIGEHGCQFTDRAVLASLTPAWDWIAVHGLHTSGAGRPECVIAFAGRDAECGPGLRVVRAQPAGTPGDAFTASALTWGHSILASVQYSDARRAFNTTVAVCAARRVAGAADTATSGADTGAAGTGMADAGAAGTGGPGTGGRQHPLDRWSVAEASLRLDAMKAKIAEITHPWPLVPDIAPDLGGQHLISTYAMRHEVAMGAARVRELLAEITGSSPVTAR
jgi:alkylation response protein AidB-like acyl-CoA dehydrogenase